MSANRLLSSLALALAALLCIEVVYAQLFSGLIRDISNADSELNSPSTSALPLLATRPPKAYQLIHSAPLFHPTRQPLGSAQVSNNLIVGNWQLTGVVKAQGRRLVMFQDIDSSRLITLEEDMFLDNWRVQDIADDRVLFVNSEETMEMILPDSMQNNLSAKEKEQPKTRKSKR